MLPRAALRPLHLRPPSSRVSLPSAVRSQKLMIGRRRREKEEASWQNRRLFSSLGFALYNQPGNFFAQGATDPTLPKSYSTQGRPRSSGNPKNFKPSPQSGATKATPPRGPSSRIPPPDTSGDKPLKDSTDYSTLQEEFKTTSDSNRNTAPQDTSPSAVDPAKEDASSRVEGRPNIPDLTKGIPSTIDAELEAASAPKNEPEHVSRPAGRDRGDRQLPASAYVTSAERRRNWLMGWAVSGVFLAILLSPVYLGRDWETEEEAQQHPQAPNGFGVGLWFNRARARVFNTVNYYSEPAYPRLPDPDPLWARPYTLVLSLEDLLVHSEWSRKNGWRTAKRPGVDYFLRYLSQYYELVVFTSAPSSLADPIIRKLDPYRMIQWPLFREATLYKNGEYIKVSALGLDEAVLSLAEGSVSHQS